MAGFHNRGTVVAWCEQEDDDSDSKKDSDGLQTGGGGGKINKVSLAAAPAPRCCLLLRGISRAHGFRLALRSLPIWWWCQNWQAFRPTYRYVFSVLCKQEDDDPDTEKESDGRQSGGVGPDITKVSFPNVWP